MEYSGTIFGFNYDIELKDDKEFQVWLKAKLLRYLFNPDDPATPVIKDILGIKELEEKVTTLENSLSSERP